MKYLAISLALGDIYCEAGTGHLMQPNDGAIARFKAVTSAIPSGHPSLVVCTAGYCKREPTEPQPEREVSLAGQLKRYVEEYEPDWLSRLEMHPLCWSTSEEIRVGMLRAIRIRFAREDEPVTVVIASNLTHLVRIWLYAVTYAPKAWKIKLVRARHHFSLRSHMLEIPKIGRDVAHIVRDVISTGRFKKQLNPET